MRGNVTVCRSVAKKTNQVRYYIYLPKRIVEQGKIVAGNIIDIDVENPYPEYIAEKKRGNNFRKKEVIPDRQVNNDITEKGTDVTERF